MRRSFTALALAATASAVLVGCGGENGGPREQPLDHVVAAASRTTSAGSSKVSVDVTISSGQAQPQKVIGDGAVDFAAGRGQLELAIPGIGSPQDRTTLVMAGDIFYIKLPPALASFSPKPWVKFDLATLGKQTGIDIAQLRQLGGNDPTAALQYLRGASGEVKTVGEEDVRGTKTTHYSATIDLTKASASAPASAKASLDNAIGLLGATTMPLDVWVDADGRVRRQKYVVDLSKAKGGGTGSVTTILELYDFGTQVTVSPPPADQTATLDQIFGGAR